MSSPDAPGVQAPEPIPQFALPYTFVFEGTPDPEKIQQFHRAVVALGELAGAQIQTGGGAHAAAAPDVAAVPEASQEPNSRLDTPLRTIVTEGLESEDEATAALCKELKDEPIGAHFMRGLDSISVSTARDALTLGIEATIKHAGAAMPQSFRRDLRGLLGGYLKAACPDIEPQDIPTAAFVADICDSVDQIDARGIPGVAWSNTRITLGQLLRGELVNVYDKRSSEQYNAARKAAQAFAEGLNLAGIPA